MPPRYHVTHFADLPVGTPGIIDDASVDHVEAQFARLRARGEYLAAHDRDHIEPWRYTWHRLNYNGNENHFQGIQRLAHGQYLAISGGDWRGSTSHVFIVRMGSRPKRGPWASNTTAKDKRPPDRDRIVGVVGIDSEMWHAGGMDVLGHILAVPVEYPPPNSLPLRRLANLPLPNHGARARSRVVFLDLSNPATPKRLRPTIERFGAKATAVALTRLSNGHYLAAVLSAQGLDFYLSRTKSFNSGFRKTPTTWHTDRLRALEGQQRKFGGYQTINFLTQSDGRLYLIGLHNTSPMAPTIGGDNNAHLFTVDIPNSTTKPLNNADSVALPVLTRVASRRMDCKHRQCNMAAAAGVFVDRGNLIVYSAYHWRHKGIVRFNQFRGLTQPRKRIVTRLMDGWIELFEKKFFDGRYLTIRGADVHDITDFGEIRVQGSGFDGKIRSARWQLPEGVRYRLFREKHFKRKTWDLEGAGTICEIADLKALVSDAHISSARLQT